MSWTLFQPIRRYRWPLGSFLETKCPPVSQIYNCRDIVAHDENIGILEGILEGLGAKPDGFQVLFYWEFHDIDMQSFHVSRPPLKLSICPYVCSNPHNLSVCVCRYTSICGVYNGIPLWRSVRVLHNIMEAQVQRVISGLRPPFVRVELRGSDTHPAVWNQLI